VLFNVIHLFKYLETRFFCRCAAADKTATNTQHCTILLIIRLMMKFPSS